MKLAGWRCVLLWYIYMVIEWCSSEVILADCVNICLSDWNVACPGTPRSSTISDRLKHEVAGLDKTSK